MAMTLAGRAKALGLKALARSVGSRFEAAWQTLQREQPGRDRGCLIVGNAPNASVDDCPFRTEYDAFVVNNGLTQPLSGLKPRFWVATDRVFFRRESPALFQTAAAGRVIPLIPVSALVENGFGFFRGASHVVAFPGERRQPAEDAEAVIVALAARRQPPILKTVTATSICLAALLGYKRVALVGCDAYSMIIAGRDLRMHHYSSGASQVGEHDAVRLSLSHRLSYHFAARYARELGTEVVNYSRTTAVEEIPRGTGKWE
jgi:hypothetical protein